MRKPKILTLALAMLLTLALTGTAFSEDRPVLKVLGGFVANMDPNDDPTQAAIEERTGYRCEYAMLPQDNPEQKLNMEIGIRNALRHPDDFAGHVPHARQAERAAPAGRPARHGRREPARPPSARRPGSWDALKGRPMASR